VSLQPKLSSASSVLHELTTRITDIAEQATGARREDVAQALFEVERSLRAAARRLDKVVSELK
jgi:hypothetical protein